MTVSSIGPKGLRATGLAICTIVARNYLPFARTLARSLDRVDPSLRLSVLILDDRYFEMDTEAEPFDVWHLEDLPAPTPELHHMAACYSVMEFATAVKPWLLEFLLSRGHTSVIYLDPDIAVYGPLSDAAELAARYEAVLTPHAVAPMPRDGRKVDEDGILSSGIYNLGFIGVGQRSLPLLAYWKERLRRECYVDPPRHRFVDQRWMDFAPGAFDCHILRDPTHNVAYWNLDHRPLSKSGSSVLVCGQPLTFFHFSGFDPEKPYVLSKHQGSTPRILVSSSPALRELCQEYADGLFCNGYASDRDTAYGFDRLANGLEMAPHFRRIYRSWITALEAAGEDLPPDAYTSAGAEQFLDWLTSRPEDSPLPRYLQHEYKQRADLQEAFPEAETSQSEELLDWAEREVVEGRLDPRLAFVPRGATSATDNCSNAARYKVGPGICVAGYLRAELGMGQLGRLAYAAAASIDVDTSTLLCSQTRSRQLHPVIERPLDAWNVNILAINADCLPGFVSMQDFGLLEDRYNIGLWAWELSTVPESWYLDALPLVDEIWALSEFERAALAQITDKPVLTFPLAAQAAPSDPIARRDLNLPDGFMFLFCFDAFSIVQRKNPDAVIEAFKRSFADDAGALLVLKVLNGDHFWEEVERIKYLAADRSDIVILDGYLDHARNVGLMASCDAYVSLHRSEGFGLTIFEAMSLSKPVIATAYSGNMDFMTDETAYLVPWEEGIVPPGCHPYPPGALWAEPDLDAAATLMREVFEDPEGAAMRGARAARSVASTHSLAVASRFVAERYAYAQKALESRRAQASGSETGHRLLTGIETGT